MFNQIEEALLWKESSQGRMDGGRIGLVLWSVWISCSLWPYQKIIHFRAQLSLVSWHNAVWGDQNLSETSASLYGVNWVWTVTININPLMEAEPSKWSKAAERTVGSLCRDWVALGSGGWYGCQVKQVPQWKLGQGLTQDWKIQLMAMIERKQIW